MRVEVGAARRKKSGETVCGDASIVVPMPSGTLMCLVDGVGHGPEAAAAAERACGFVESSADAPLESLMRGLDRALVGTRGAAVSIVQLMHTHRVLRYVGIGNVELRALTRARVAPPTTPGIVGQGLRVVRVWEYPLAEGDLVTLMSDGVTSRFDLEDFAHLDPASLAVAVVARHHRDYDDASCVVARVVAEVA